MTFIDWLNANTGAVQAIATVVLVVITVVYVAYTRALAVENRLLRKAGTDPQVVAYASLSPHVFGVVEFVIANVGKGAAKNIEFEIVNGADDFSAKDVPLKKKGASFKFLPQDDKIKTFLGMGWELRAEPRLKPFNVRVSYESMSEEKRSEYFNIDVYDFDGLQRVGTPPEQELAEHVKKIAKSLEQLASRKAC